MYRSLDSENVKEIMEKVAHIKACEENLKEYSLEGLSEVYDDFCESEDKDIDKFIKAYNDFIYIKEETQNNYLVMLGFAQTLSEACDISNHFASRNKKSKLEGRWLSVKEIAEYLEKDYYVHIVKYKNKRIEKRIEKTIESIDELREACNSII